MNPYAKGNTAYKKASVTTQDQGSLILMLFDGAVRFLKTAIIKLEANDLEQSHNYIIKGKDIIAELISSLDLERSGEVGRNLKVLYVYMFNQLIDANIQKDAQKVKDVLVILEEVREGWRAVLNQKKATTQDQRFNSRGAVKPIQIKG